MTTAPLFKAIDSSIDKAEMTDPLQGSYGVTGPITYWSEPMCTASSTHSSVSGHNMQRDTSKIVSCIIYNSVDVATTGRYNNNLFNHMYHWKNRILDVNDGVVKLFERVEIRTVGDNESDTETSRIRMYLSSAPSNIPEGSYDELIPPESASNEKKLISLIQQEPIEEGYGHPAEDLIEASLKLSPFNPTHWVYNTYVHNTKSHPTIAASVLRSLSRSPRSLIQPWGLLLAIQGLTYEDVEIRDAAVRALERWGGRDAFMALQNQAKKEPVSWLRAYIKQVIVDMAD